MEGKICKWNPPLNICPSGFPVCVSFARFPSLLFSVRHIVLSNRHVCVPLEVTFSFSDWIRREWLNQLNTNVHFEKNPVWWKQGDPTKSNVNFVTHVHIELLSGPMKPTKIISLEFFFDQSFRNRLGNCLQDVCILLSLQCIDLSQSWQLQCGKSFHHLFSWTGKVRNPFRIVTVQYLAKTHICLLG